MAISLATVFALSLPAVASAAKHTVTVKKTGTGSGTVKCEVAGSGIQGSCGTYVEGTELVIYATPNKGFIFAGWTDEYCSFYGAEPCELTIEEEDITVVAEFGPIPKYPLTIEIEGSGTGTVKCEVAGSGTAGTCASAYVAETELVLYATPGTGSMFAGWTDEYCSFYGAEPCELTIEEEPITVVAEFGSIPEYPLTIEMGGSGTGTVKCEVAGSGAAGTCSPAYPAGTELNLFAIAGPGSEFVEWTGACVNAGCQLTIEEEATVTAIFKSRPQVAFSVVKSGTGTGTVTCDGGACASSYSEGDEVTLVASPAAGSTFAGWSGGGCSSTGSCTVAIKAGMTVTATFDANPTPPPSEPEGKARAASFARVSGRNAALRLTCSGGSCQGTLKLTARVRRGTTVKRMVIGRTSFSLSSGAPRTLTVKLSAAARKELDKRGSLKAKLTGTGVVGSTVRLGLRR